MLIKTYKTKIVLLSFLVLWAFTVQASQKGWQRQEVDWRMTGGTRIKAIKHPKDKKPKILSKRDGQKIYFKKLSSTSDTKKTAIAQKNAAPISAAVIDSPPIDGFVPWIAVTTTDAKGAELELDAVVQTSVTGSYTASNPQTDYIIGIFDTGASAHVMGNAAAHNVNLFTAGLVTNNPIDITGVTGSVEAFISYPLGIFIDGLKAIELGLLNTADMKGESNVSIVVGQSVTPPEPDLPTAIGTPLSVYFTTAIYNDQQITVDYDGQIYNAPDIRFFEPNDAAIPEYPQIIPLELRPLGGISVQYVPDFGFYDLGNIEDLFNLDFSTPGSPSIIIGNASQSVFFVHSVDITEADKSALDKDRFMLDTGAQVTVLGYRIGARLGLDPANPDFTVVIQGVSGGTSTEPGFYIDSLQIPALGGWLNFTNIPVILLDIASPEGGTLDGIIGMNLFSGFNLVLRGGGLFLQDNPSLELEPVQFSAIPDFAPGEGDGIVNSFDLAVFIHSWLATPSSQNWNLKCDIAPSPIRDGKIDFLDFAVLAQYWQQNITP